MLLVSMSEAVDSEPVWRALHGELQAFFLRRVRDEHATEDLVQDTFVRVQRGLASLRDDERLTAWVHRIARNVLAEHRRRARLPEQADADHDALPDDERDDEEEPLNALVAGWLPAFTAELPDEHRAALELAELEGLTRREVAERLGLSLSGAKSRVQRGRGMLRAALARCCELEFDRRGNVIGYEQRGECGGCDEGSAPCA